MNHLYNIFISKYEYIIYALCKVEIQYNIRGGEKNNMAIVYHYCDHDTFTKIIKNKTLRLSDIRKSNDLYEMNLFLKQHQGIGDLSEIANHQDDGFWKSLEEYMKLMTDQTECFASCLSCGSDRLSQWERYGGSCAGLALGFNKEKLQDYIDKLGKSLKEKDTFAKLVAKKVTYKKLAKYSYPSEMVDKFHDIINYLEECSFTKHYGFKEEKEFRIALMFYKDKKDFLLGDFLNYIDKNEFNSKSYETTENGTRDHIDLVFNHTLIDEVYIGPLSTFAEEDIRAELRNRGINCRVKKSEIPYDPKRK